jgi:hypothetical protein
VVIQISRAELASLVYESLSAITIRGFEPSEIDAPGSATFLVDTFGRAAEADPANPGIIATDYDQVEPDQFAVLIDSVEVDALRDQCVESGYEVITVEPITSPQLWGDTASVVEIVQTVDGWAIFA